MIEIFSNSYSRTESSGLSTVPVFGLSEQPMAIPRPLRCYPGNLWPHLTLISHLPKISCDFFSKGLMQSFIVLFENNFMLLLLAAEGHGRKLETKQK
jgi:hypothetical protein